MSTGHPTGYNVYERYIPSTAFGGVENDVTALLSELVSEVRGLRADLRAAEKRRDPLFRRVLQGLGRHIEV